MSLRSSSLLEQVGRETSTVPIIVDYPQLHINPDTTDAIATKYHAMRMVDPVAIRQNAIYYVHAADDYAQASSVLHNNQTRCETAWTHRGDPILNIPENCPDAIDRRLNNIRDIGCRLEHIAAIAELAQKHGDRLIANYQRGLSLCAAQIDNNPREFYSQYHQQVYQSAHEIAEHTRDDLDRVAQVYQDTIAEVPDGPLGMNLRRLPPLYGKDNQPHYWEVGQSNFNDCFFLSSIGVLAQCYPDVIKDAIVEDPQHSGNYRVTLFHDASGALTTQDVSTADVLKDLKRGGYDQRSGDGGALWPYVLETAYAKFRGSGSVAEGDRIIDHGGSESAMLQTLLGHSVSCLASEEELADQASITTKYNIAQQLISAHAQGRPIVMGTNATDENPKTFTTRAGHPMTQNHVYMVVGVDSRNKTVHLRNPWGWAHEDRQNIDFDVPIDELLDNNVDFAIG